MKPVTILIAKYTAILVVGFFVNWWVFDLSNFNIPENIPSTPIHISGLTLIIIIITVLIFAQKSMIMTNPDARISELTFVGTLIGLFAEIFFQSVRVFTLEEDKLHYFLKGVIGVTIAMAIISFLISFQIKTKKTNQLLLFIFLFLIVFKIMIYLFPSIA